MVYFEAWSLTGAELSDCSRLAHQEALGIHLSLPPCAEITSLFFLDLILMWVLDIIFRSSCLCNKDSDC